MLYLWERWCHQYFSMSPRIPTVTKLIITALLLLQSVTLPLSYLGAKTLAESYRKNKTLQQQGDKHVSKDYWACFSWKNCLEKLRLQADCVFFGDSITRGSDFGRAYPDLCICNLGYSGNNLQGMMNRTEQIQVLHPRKIFIMGGINDLPHTPLESFISQYQVLLEKVRAENPEAEIIVQNMLPVVEHKVNKANAQIKQYNEALAQLCTKLGIRYLDIHDLYADTRGQLPEHISKDGIHLKEEGYQRWEDYLRQQQLLPPIE